MKKTIFIGLIIILAVIVVGLGVVFGYKQFRNLGGAELVNMITYALSFHTTKRNEILKKFLYNDDKSEISGFFAYSWDKKVKIWNLTGLRSYTVHPFTLYYYYDICRINESGKQVTDSDRMISGQKMYKLSSMLKKIKPGDYVELQMMQDGGRFYIYKFWTYSGNFYMNTGLTKECIK